MQSRQGAVRVPIGDMVISTADVRANPNFLFLHSSPLLSIEKLAALHRINIVSEIRPHLKSHSWLANC